MKKKRIQLIAIIFAIVFPMTGCGTPLYSLTEDEEKLIVHYAAHVVSKYNITQTDGMNGTRSSIEEEEDKKDKYILEEIPKHQHYTNLDFSDFFLREGFLIKCWQFSN